jgi:hypothetical protein
MSRIKTLMALCLTLLLLLPSACQRKDLLEPHDHYNLIIKANFDDHALSQLLSHKSDGYSKPGEPKTTKYVIYEKTTQKVARTGSFKGLQGGVYLPEGIYDLLVYTSDFNEYDANFFRGLDKKETSETYTRQSTVAENSSRSDVTEMYMVEPDPTFAVLSEDIIVFEGHEDQLLEVELVQKSFKYYLTIKAKGLQNIHTAKMHISGMYTTAYLTHEEHRMNEAGIQTVDMEITRYDPKDVLGEGEIYGEFWSFGPNVREDISNTITLYFINGDVITMKLQDLSPQIKTLTRGGEIIVTEKLEIKGPASGFQPGVGDWNDPTDVEIIL